MSVSQNLESQLDSVSFDLESIPMDVFDLADSGLELESLTGGHGLPDNGASSTSACSCCAFCSS